MKHFWLIALCGGWISVAALAQNTTASIWRCGNEYTNQPNPGMACTRVPVQSDVISTTPRKFHAVPPSSPAMPNTTVVVPAPHIDGQKQRERDLQAQQILLEELKKLQSRCKQLGPQSTEVVRCQSDEAALRRELARAP